MASALPVLSGQQVVRAFEKLSWQVARQRSSHIIMTKPGEVATLSVPDHKVVARGTFAKPDPENVTVQEFVHAAQ